MNKLMTWNQINQMLPHHHFQPKTRNPSHQTTTTLPSNHVVNHHWPPCASVPQLFNLNRKPQNAKSTSCLHPPHIDEQTTTLCHRSVATIRIKPLIAPPPIDVETTTSTTNCASSLHNPFAPPPQSHEQPTRTSNQSNQELIHCTITNPNSKIHCKASPSSTSLSPTSNHHEDLKTDVGIHNHTIFNH